jgi:MFS family permease
MSPDRRPFLTLMAASAVSQVGNMMTAVAVPWLVFEESGSATLVGLTGAAIAIGAVAPAVLGGPLVDRFGARRTSVAGDLLNGAAVAAIALLQFLGVLEFWQLITLVFLLTSFTAQAETGRLALIPGLASRASMSLERSNATDRGIARAGQLVGPLLAGVLIPVIGPFSVLLLDATTSVISAVLVASGVPSASPAPAAADTSARTRDYRAELSEGLRFVIGNRLILTILLLCLVGNFFDLPLLTVVLPVYANEIFGSPQSLGLMLASFAAGGLAGTILFGAVGRGLPRRRLFLWGWLFAVLITYGALSAQVPLFVVILAALIGGLAAGPVNPIILTVVQENTPPHLMGRVFGAATAFAQAGIPFGAVLAGLAIESAGLIPIIAVGGAVYLLVLGLMFFNPALRRMDAAPAEAPVAAAAEEARAQASPQARRAATMKAGLP